MSEFIIPYTEKLYQTLDEALRYLIQIESFKESPKARYVNAKHINDLLKTLDTSVLIQDSLLSDLELQVEINTFRFKNIKRKYDKIIEYKINKELLLNMPIDYDNIQYKRPNGEIYSIYSNPNLTEEIINVGYKKWITFSSDRVIELQKIMGKLINDYQNEYFKVNINSKDFFINYLRHPNKDRLLVLMHNLLDGAKTKDFAKFIISLRDLNYIYIPTPKTNLYDAMRVEFVNIGKNSGMNNYFADNSDSQNLITTLEIESTKRIIEEGLK